MTERPELLTPNEVAAILRITPRAVLKMIAAGKLGAVRVGSRWRIARAQLDLMRALAGASGNMRAPAAVTMTSDSEDER